MTAQIAPDLQAILVSKDQVVIQEVSPFRPRQTIILLPDEVSKLRIALEAFERKLNE